MSAVAIWLTGVAVTAAQTPDEVARDYLSEGQAIAARHFAEGGDANRDAWVAWITNGDGWLDDRVGDGALELFRKVGIYGGGTVELDAPALAGQAARVTGRLRLRETPDFTWPLQVDLIQVDDEWRLRATRLTTRRPLAATASPLEVVDGYLAHLTRSLARLADADDSLPLADALGSELAQGAGFWTTGARGQAVGIYGHLRSVEPETVTTRVGGTADETATVQLRTERARRTMTQVTEWTLELTRDGARGWEIAGATREEAEAASAPTSAPASTDGGSGPADPLALVERVLTLAATADLAAFSDATADYFADSSDGRRAAGQLVAMGQLSQGTAPRWTLSDAGSGQVRAELVEGAQALRMMMPVLIVSTTSDAGVVQITGVETRRD